MLFTSNAELVDRDQVILCGKDLGEIRGDCDFARIVLLRIGVLDHVVLGDIPSRRRPDGTLDTAGCLEAVPRFHSISASGALDFPAP